MAGGRATLLHHMFQRNGITPDQVYAKPPGVRAFMFASTMIRIEMDERGEKDGRGNTD